MENKAIDRRIQRTRQLLHHAMISLILEKGYDAITVQDIIDRANVGRATFYAHFQDKEDLFLNGFETMRTHLMQFMSERCGSNPWEMVLVMFQHAQDQVKLYKIMVGKHGSNIVIEHMNMLLSSVLMDHFRPHFEKNRDIQVPLEVLVRYLVGSLLSLLVWWLDQDLPYTPEQMYEMFCKLAQPGVESLIRQ